ncbi:hypothetical protein GGTG_05485 [Gaeumannomyces tritici R3-111a-1]|uniref:Amine oxidase domain-containing protein n=1 Tax=Gaeumannomyces tritici (strain R3-111a-1) TaxID=644352 RepID=J3NW22_GAET3|nr:hypothetical protein GGTG_05485 [Gaeumannomyces tritici R3-111a-1]EJT75552.1 hypothetical protein GGTG_05485 [Gaeumannomyces tritici R3-111a-1]
MVNQRLLTALAWSPLLIKAAPLNGAEFTSVITRDVAILGGGASGSHAAVRLREDFGHSVVVVEAKDHLGGHVATYNDPVTKSPYDFGVNSYVDTGGARAFFGRMGVNTSSPTRALRTNVYADFRTGEAVPNWVSPNNSAALETYLQLCLKYQDLMLPSYDKFPAGKQIPEELLMPFGEFVAKHGIQAALPIIFTIAGMGTGGNMLKLPTLYMMQAFGVPMIMSLRPTTGMGFVPASRNNSELYGNIGRLLGNDVLYSSRVEWAERRNGKPGCPGGVKLVVRRADGSKVLVKAKRLLVAFEPTLEALNGLGTDRNERDVFRHWKSSRGYVGIVTHPALPAAVSIINTPAEQAPDNYLVDYKGPFVVRYEHYGAPSNLYRVLMFGEDGFTAEQAKALTQTSFDKLVAKGVVPANATGEPVKFVAFSDHRQMHLHFSPEELKAGFIQKQYALQGYRSTFYTGAAWTAQFTNAVWTFNDEILPKVVKGLKK